MNTGKIFIVAILNSIALINNLFTLNAQAAPEDSNTELIKNGSFESGIEVGSSFTDLQGGDSESIPGWVVTPRTNIDYIGTFWLASDGIRSIDLNGAIPGGIYQIIHTKPNHFYQISFDMAGNPGSLNLKRLKIKVSVKKIQATAGGRFLLLSCLLLVLIITF